MNTILVTGGTGYVGSRVAEALYRRGYHVIVVDIVPPEEREIVFSEGITYRQADLRIPEEALRSLVDAEVIMHLASDIGSMTYMREHKADIIKNNSAIDAAVYPALEQLGIPWIIYSSSSMAFQHPPKFPYTEADITSINPPTNTYGFSKLAGEYFCRAYAEQYGINFTIVRYHNIYGPGEDSKGATPGDIHVIPALLEKVISGQYPLEFLGADPDKATRPFVYVDDAVAATVSIIERAVNGEDVVKNEDFNIGNDIYYTILDLGRLIWEEYGDEREFSYIIVPTKQDTALRREVDITKVKTLGWQPTTTLRDGLRPTAEWIKNRKQKH
jgi:nucleoside-diphosphate-sugar epimerase